MAFQNIAAQNGTTELKLSGDRNAAAAIGTSVNTSATAVFVLEGKVENSDLCPWVAITTRNPSANPTAEQANITGASKAGWADMPGFALARIRRTDATGGNGECFINSRSG